MKLPDYKDVKVDKYVLELNKLNIKYRMENLETNDVKPGMIAKCSKDVGDLVNVEESEEIIVYVAVAKPKEPTVEAESTAEAPESSAQTAEAGSGIPVE